MTVEEKFAKYEKMENNLRKRRAEGIDEAEEDIIMDMMEEIWYSLSEEDMEYFKSRFRSRKNP
jgi:hypothetical protein